MSEWKLIRLQFGRNVAHFGELGIGIEETSERIRSDTLFSAWLSTYARLLGRSEVEQLIEQFQSSPPFRLSSTFIYQRIDSTIVDYLPRPMKVPSCYPASEDDLGLIKTYKKLTYLPLEIWQRWYQGEGFSVRDRAELTTKTTETGTGALTESGEFRYREAFEIQKLPKIAVDRITRATNLYHTGIVQYRCEQQGNQVESLSGLYFLAEFFDPEVIDTFLAVLDFLGGEGIGGERSSGAGQFKVHCSELTPEWQQVINFDSGNYHSLISLFWQSSLTPELLDRASYELQERGGWITSSTSDGRQLRRKAVRMFAEGSVFSTRPIGQLADVTPGEFRDHRVYRSGISLSLPIRIQDE
jgi:CRISPR-associated protein Csm4